MLGRAAIIFLLFSLGSSATTYAQSEPVAGGKYSIRNAGFEIQFPSGWNSTSINDMYVIVRPADAELGGVPNAMMTVIVMDRQEIRRLMMSEIGVDSGHVIIYEDEACNSLVDEIVSLSGTMVFHTIHECTREDGYSKTNTYIIFTLTKAIVINLSATSAEAYDQYVAAFESSLKTIRVDGPVDFRLALEIILGTTNIVTHDIDLESDDGQVKLTAATSSRISDINFDKGSKRIMIAVDEQKRLEGHLLIPIHRLLLGPYQVYVDGESSHDFLVISDEVGKNQLMDVRYGKGVHKIEITGTQVVPEFNIGIMGVVAATLSVVLLYRLRSGLVARQIP